MFANLSVVKEIRTTMNGVLGMLDLLVDSQREDSNKSRIAPPEMTPDGNKLRVLLAEDNLVTQEVGKLILECLDCRVDVVEDGACAIERIFSTCYDLVFMDCQMPEVDGYEAAKIIRKKESLADGERQRIPIVALTAHALEGDRELCLAAGMDDYLSKPFNASQIAAMLQKWTQARNQPQDDQPRQI